VNRVTPVEVDSPVPWVVVARVSGDMDESLAARLVSEVEAELARRRPCRLVLDLGGVTGLSQGALGGLRRLHRRCRTDDVRLVLVGAAHPAVHRPLRLSGLLTLFETLPTVEHALPHPQRMG
jgi:anti-anti-sigma factor